MSGALSLNEIAVTLRKAALGADWPLGSATDIGDAAAWLCANGHDGVAAALIAILAEKGDVQTEKTENGWILHGAPVVLTGPSALDLALAFPDPVTLFLDAGHDAFLGLAGLASQQTGKRITLDGAVQATLLSGALEGAVSTSDSLDHLTVSVSDCDRQPALPTGRHAPRAEDWAEVRRLAALILVPDSEASRARGAGAGGIDSD